MSRCGKIAKKSQKSILKRAANALSKKVTKTTRATPKPKASAVKKEVKSKLKTSKKKSSIKSVKARKPSRPIKSNAKIVKAKAKTSVKKSAKKVSAKTKAVKSKTKTVKKTANSSSKKIKTGAKKVKTVKKAAKTKTMGSIKKVKAKKSRVKVKKSAKAKPKKTTKKVDKFVPLAPLPPKPKVNALKDERLRTYLERLVGEEGMTIVKKIHGKEVSDVDLAEKMDMKPNIIRKHLYKMYEVGVVTYRRHRSKTGWYTYYWQLHPERIMAAIDAEKEIYAKELEQILKYEIENHFYECKKKCTRAVFEEAIQREFKCPRCENQLVFTDNQKRVRELERQIEGFRALESIE